MRSRTQDQESTTRGSTSAMGLVASLGLTVAACTGLRHVQCEEHANCDLLAGGMCMMASTGNQWCAYPDGSCPSGYRYSTEDIEDGVSGVCTEAQYTLTVSVGGSGSGEVIAIPSGLTCAEGTCTGSFPSGTEVQLAASVRSGAFLGWLDACAGTASCTITMDQDRTVGALFGTRGEELWVNQLGGGSTESGQGIASDPNGDVIAVGSFIGTVQIGTETLTSNGATDAFIVKLSRSNGGVIWARRFGGRESAAALAAAVAVDASSSIYVAGVFGGDVDFGGGAVSAINGDGFLVKLDPDGNHVWSRQIGGTGYSAVSNLSVKGSTIAVIGGFRDSLDVNGTTLTSVGGADGFVVTLTTDGAFAWAKRFGGGGDDGAYGVAVDNSGDVWLTGEFIGTIDFGGGPLNSGASYDMYLAKVAAANGAHLLSKRLGSAGYDHGDAVVVDSANNIFLLGDFDGTVDFGGPAPLIASEKGSIVVAKYTAAGSYLWARASNATDFHGARSAVVDQGGDIVIGGQFSGTLTFDGRQLSARTSWPDYDLFVARFSGIDGAHVNSVCMGGIGDESHGGLTRAPDGRLFVTGSFKGSSELAGRTLMSTGLADAFMLALAPL